MALCALEAKGESEPPAGFQGAAPLARVACLLFQRALFKHTPPRTLPRERRLPHGVMGLQLVQQSRTSFILTSTFLVGCRSGRQSEIVAGTSHMLPIVETFAKGGRRPCYRRYPERPRDVFEAWPPNVKMRHCLEISRKILSLSSMHATVHGASNFEVT